MYLFGLVLLKDSMVDRMPGRREWDGCIGSRRMRTVLMAARMAMSRRGSLCVALLAEGDSERSGDWKIFWAALRSPVACAIVPAVYSIRHRTSSERFSPSSWAICRSSLRFCLAKSQSVRAHARNTCCSIILQHSVLRHSMRLFAFTIDSATFSGVSKLPEEVVRYERVNVKGRETDY